MQKLAVGIVFLVFGAIIGLSVGMFFFTHQTPIIEEEVKVTIQHIEYSNDPLSTLEIILLNEAPEKNLEGNVRVSQGENSWTNAVNWHYTGYGEVEVICDSVNVTESFHVAYIENSPRETYLDKIIDWDEVTLNIVFNFMNTEQLQITDVAFTHTGAAMKVTVLNTGTTDVIITSVSVTGNGVTGAALLDDADVTVTESSSGTIDIDITGSWTAGNLYNVELLSTKGNKFTYTATA